MAQEAVMDNNTVVTKEDKLFNRNKWIFSASGIARDLAYTLVSIYLLNYLQFGVQLNVAQFSVLYAVIAIFGKVWDGINDPMMGAIIESSNMKWGKFKPWILIGAIGIGILDVIMFNVHLEGWAFVAFMTVTYLLWESFFTMNDIGYWAMLPSLSSKTSQRNSITMLTVLFAGVGAILAQAVIPTLTTGNMIQGYALVSIGIAIILIAAQTLCAVFVVEKPREKENQEKITIGKMLKVIKANDQVLWMTLAMLAYSIGSSLLIALAPNVVYLEIGYDGGMFFYIVAGYGVTTVVGNILYTCLAAKLGRRKLQLYSILVACVGYFIVAIIGWTSILPFSIWLMLAGCILIAGGQTLFYTASIVNMTNCVEYNEYKSGNRNEAVISTLRPFMVKIADAIKYGITILALVISGVYSMSQSISALESQKSVFDNLTMAQQEHYIDVVQEYAIEISDTADSELTALYADINKEITGDSTLSSYKLKAENIVDINNTTVVLTKDGKEESKVAFANIDETTLSGDIEYNLFINDAADIAFRDQVQKDTGARVIIRVCVTIVPIVLLLIALYVQRKRFFIDEEYYDNMMLQLNERAAANVAEE